MLWRQELRRLEKSEEFDEAIALLEKVIREDPDDVERYIFMLYLLADLIIEPHHSSKYKEAYENKHYRILIKKYFDESCPKFSHHPDKSIRAKYLYYVGWVAVFGWYLLGIDDIGSEMIHQAKREDPDNPVYKLGEPGNHELAKQLLDPNSQVRKILDEKGAIGDYLISTHKSWAHYPGIKINEPGDKDKEIQFSFSDYEWWKKRKIK